MPFVCSICGESSMQICARCTKDACDNHLCPKCLRCSDCCECELALDEPVPAAAHGAVAAPAPVESEAPPAESEVQPAGSEASPADSPGPVEPSTVVP